MSYPLGRIVNHDPQSKMYPHELPVDVWIRDVTWQRYSPIIDQGNLGCCTGAAMAGWLGCAPHVQNVEQANGFDLEYAHKLYSRATHIDPFPGYWPPDDTGSSGLAVAKAAKEFKNISSYRWAFSVDGLVKALQSGPVIIGIPWYEGMFTPDRDGRIWPTGAVAGGHEVLIRGLIGRDLILSNSWGTGWGMRGEAFLPLDVWATLRKQQADVTIPVI
jgi:hypothetical protein